MKRVKTAWLIGAGALGAALLPTGARAQNASIREIVRVVKTIRAGSSALSTARIDGSLTGGDRLRTGGRSAAGIRFDEDRSLLRVGELSEILITGGRGRDAQMVRGRVLADYKTPTTLRSGNAIAAIRGTQVEMIYEASDRRTKVNCYHGRVFVSSARNPIRAGTADTLTATTLTDTDLQGSDVNWVGGEVRFVDGPYRGETRKVTGFDRDTGTVTLEPALPAGGAQDGVHGYLVVRNPNGRVVELLDNMGTEVEGDGDPADPYRIPHKGFAGLSRFNYWQELEDGLALYVYPGTPQHEQDREESWNERDVIDRITSRPRVRLRCGCGAVIGQAQPGHAHHAGMRQHLSSALAASVQERAPRPSGAGLGTDSPTPEYRTLPGIVSTPGDPGNRNQQFRFEPFAFASNESDAAGARVRYQATSGSVYAEFGYRFLRLDSDNQHDLSEALVHIKGKYGDVIAGRQHLFLGPSNNNQVGRLLGLESTDAVVYQLPMPKGFRQQVGYIFDTRAIDPGGFNAAYARGQARLGYGNIGYSLMAEPGEGHFGWQIDAAQPLVRNVVDLYAEGGQDTRGRDLVTAGFYVPWLYHKAKVDLFVEYARREGVDERASLRIRRELGSGLLLVGFLDQRLDGGGLTAGGGILWSRKFR